MNRRKIRLIECNAKCRYLKKLTCTGILGQVFYLSEPLLSYGPVLPPYTLYTCIQYSMLIHTGKEGEITKEKIRGPMAHKAGQKYQHD
jgi:hypothetical protein